MKQKMRVGRLRDGSGRRRGVSVRIVVGAVVAAHHLDGGGWAVGHIAVDGAIAVVHGPTNSRGPRCLPLRLPCEDPETLLPG